MESPDEWYAAFPAESEADVRWMRVGSLTKMSFIFASRISSGGSDLSEEVGDLWSLVSNGLNVLGRDKGGSGTFDIPEGSI